MSYDPTLSSSLDRIRLAVSDTEATELLSDDVYVGLLKATATQVQTVSIGAASDLLTLEAHPYTDGDVVIVSWLTVACGIDDTAAYVVINADTDTFQLATSPTGSAIAITADAVGQLGIVSEAACIQAAAGALAMTYAKKFSDVTLPSGLRVAWRDRVSAWQAIATGKSGGLGMPSRATGFRLRRGSKPDYTLGDGDE